jgi:hypothetical protein
VDAAAAAGAAAAARELQLSSSASRAASIALPVFAPPQAEEDDMLGNFSPALLVNASNPEYAVKKNVKPVTVIERLTADHARSLVGLPSDHVSEETKIESRGALALFRKAHPGLNRSTPDEYATEEEEEVGADLDAGSAAPRWSGRRGSAIERSHAAIEQQVWQPPSEYDETYISYDEFSRALQVPRRLSASSSTSSSALLTVDSPASTLASTPAAATPSGVCSRPSSRRASSEAALRPSTGLSAARPAPAAVTSTPTATPGGRR